MQHAMQMRQCGASCSRQKLLHAAEGARLAASSSAMQHHHLWHLPAPTTSASSAAGSSTVKRLTSCSAAARDASETRSEKLLRESAQVEDRVSYVDGMSALKVQLAKAGDKLVVLELQGEGVCDSGFDEEAELHWKLDEESQARKRQEACMRIKHVFQRTARDCPDVVFLNMQVPEGVEGEDIKEQLGVQRLPSVIFFKQGELLWQQEGFEGMEQQIGEGVLYYGDSAGGGVKASQYVTELTSLEELHAFMGKQPADMLTVVNVSTSLCTPCVKVYPAVLALAKNFVGQASFARILGDEVHNPHQLMAELRVLEVPTFIFYRNNKEVGRLVGSSRGDLIGHILKLQADAGIRPPPPPPGSGRGSAGRAKARAPAASRWR